MCDILTEPWAVAPEMGPKDTRVPLSSTLPLAAIAPSLPGSAFPYSKGYWDAETAVPITTGLCTCCLQ